jgi:hypothetical protein
MNTDAQPVASSATVETPVIPATAVDQAVASNDVSAFREARRAERSGKPLAPSTPDSASGEPVDQAASTDATSKPPASEPGKPKKNADTRVQELLADRARERERAERAERELAALRTGQTPPKDVKADSSPAAAAETFPEYEEYLKTAGHEDHSYERYLREQAKHIVREEMRAEREQADREAGRQRAAQSVQERDTQFRKRLDEATKADPAFMETLSDDVMALRPFSAIRDANGRWTEQPTGYHAVADEVLSSEVAPQLLRHFSDHPEDLHRIAKMLPTHLLKEMGRLEARITSGAPQTPPTKVISDAPPPAPTLSTRSSDSGSASDAAVQSGDVAAYRQARLRERTANLR